MLGCINKGSLSCKERPFSLSFVCMKGKGAEKLLSTYARKIDPTGTGKCLDVFFFPLP